MIFSFIEMHLYSIWTHVSSIYEHKHLFRVVVVVDGAVCVYTGRPAWFHRAQPPPRHVGLSGSAWPNASPAHR